MNNYNDPASMTDENVTIKANLPVALADPLSLDIPDADLIKIIDKRVEDSRSFFKRRDLYSRRKKNEMYVLGKQLKEKEKNNELKPYESRALDNALYEIEQSIKPVAMGNLPDMIVYNPKTGGESDESDDITQFIDDTLRKRQIKNALATAFRHHPVYFTGVLKAVWNPETQDFEFRCVHPNHIDIDHTATDNDANKMSFKSEILPVTVQDVIMRFPKKEKEFREELTKHGVVSDEMPEWKQMASKVYIQEIEFSMNVKKEVTQDTQSPEQKYDESQDEPGVKWERVFGVMWKYEKCLLGKMKDPNYDWEGQDKFFIYDDPSLEETKREVTPEEIMQSMISGIQLPIQKEKVYKNYFKKPQSHYFFLGYDQWGEMAYDETSRVEQNIYNQENLDTRGKQINETLANRGKHIWSKDGGMKASIIERMDMNDPQQDGLVEGDVNRMHKFIEPERPTQQEFQDEQNTRTKMFSVAGATNLNGTLQSDTATSNQIAREANYTRIDDLIDTTINAACEWMAGWMLQFIKLRYTEQHYTRILGSKGKAAYIKISSDTVEDGMEVSVKASGSDRQRTQKNAMDLASLQMIDPLSLLRALRETDPEGRTEMLMTYSTDPMTYLQKYVLKVPPLPPMMPPAQSAPVDPNAPQDPNAQAVPPQGQQQPPAPSAGQAATPTDTAQMQTAPPQGVQASPSNGVL